MSDKNNNLNEEEFEDAFDQVTLTLEDGSEMTCDVIAIFPCGERDYIALLPENDPDGDFLLYRFIDNGDGNYDLDDIGDDDEFDAASEAFDELMDNEDYDEMFGDEDE
ncbi:MAG: DUF1292 domain-containing protein [Lachnospiraceae bacterium]|jgi:uncharacterized protein YrzB (UPF0473 family)|nr:DUF1292 domain-containing protein [Lachnospiraceae bacterium]MBR4145715.1 DUF1292 domain-containing protein [Lachnospiraceae bacterium]MBR4777819.1 DUF1292 domain-containing protein [Lachnospiraceae bacterium]MBR4780967.1 DUF1292 domain-containing protein [Lachnospiraceae bacterium]MBR4816211.1 DUF1292 domain-containing protein [Lachnospiraceae bacterium]